MARLTDPVLVIPAKPDVERDAVADAWQRRGWTVRRLDRFWEPPELGPTSAKLYGNELFCLTVAQKLGLKLVSPSDDALAHVGSRWLKREVRTAFLGEAARLAYPLFAKPVVPKLFGAGVFHTPQELADETKGLEPAAAILTSEPVTIEAEARCLVLHDEVLSGAICEGEGDLDEAIAFASAFVRENDVPVTVAVDVCLIAERGWAVLELNAVWGAGLNGCDPEAMADCLVEATRAGTSDCEG